MHRHHLVLVALAALAACGAGVDVEAFRYKEDLGCLQSGQRDGTIFCILGRPGADRGIMPAVFLRGADGRLDEVWRDCDRGHRPWKIAIVELDGDPLPEIALGVYKKTRHDRRLARRLFVYDWTGSALTPKWLGSALALPLVDFAFIENPSGGPDDLVSTEVGPSGLVFRRYRWNGFGFVAMEKEQT